MWWVTFGYSFLRTLKILLCLKPSTPLIWLLAQQSSLMCNAVRDGLVDGFYVCLRSASSRCWKLCVKATPWSRRIHVEPVVVIVKMLNCECLVCWKNRCTFLEGQNVGENNVYTFCHCWILSTVSSYCQLAFPVETEEGRGIFGWLMRDCCSWRLNPVHLVHTSWKN